MTGFWRNWMTFWVAGVGLFGLVLAGGAAEATSGPAYAFFDLVDGAREPVFDQQMRLTVAVLGAVTIGWTLTLHAAMRVADRLGGEQGRSIWSALTVAVTAWYVIDSALSVVTEYPLNAVSNTAFFAAFLLPVLRSGVLATGPATASRAART